MTFKRIGLTIGLILALLITTAHFPNPIFASSGSPVDFKALQNSIVKDGELEKVYETLQNIAKDHQTYPPNIRSVALFHLLEIDDLLTNTAAMLAHATELLELSKETKSIDDTLLADYYLSQVYANQLNMQMAQLYLDEMTDLSSKYNRNYLRGITLYSEALKIYRFGDYKSTQALFLEAQNTLTNSKSSLNWFFPYHLTMIHYYNDSFDVIDKSIRKQLSPSDVESLIKKNQSLLPDENLRLTFSVAMLYANLNDLENAKKYLLKSQEAYAFFKMNKPIGSFKAFIDEELAYVYYAQKDYKAAADIIFSPVPNGTLHEAIDISSNFQSQIRSLESQPILNEIYYQRIALFVSIALLIVLFIASFIIIKENQRIKKLTREVYEKSITDGLTGLYNRVSIIEKLDDLPREFAAVALLDLDHFKQVNDTFGHLCGDEVLCAVSNTLKKAVSNIGWAGRYGGEEFMIVFDTRLSGSPIAIAEAIRTEIENTPWSFGLKTLTASIGLITSMPEDFNEGFKQVDLLLYEAKASGRNTLRFR